MALDWSVPYAAPSDMDTAWPLVMPNKENLGPAPAEACGRIGGSANKNKGHKQHARRQIDAKETGAVLMNKWNLIPGLEFVSSTRGVGHQYTVGGNNSIHLLKKQFC